MKEQSAILKKEMKNSTESLENRDEDISQEVGQREKYGKYERKAKKLENQFKRSNIQREQRNQRGNQQQNNRRKVPKTKAVQIERAHQVLKTMGQSTPHERQQQKFY